MPQNDYCEIINLVSSYPATLDANDVAGMAGLFLPDGILQLYGSGETTPSIDCRSTKERIDVFTSARQAMADRKIQSRHNFTNHIVTFKNGRKEADVTMYVLLAWYPKGMNAPHIVITGHAAAEAVKTKEGWKFASLIAWADNP